MKLDLTNPLKGQQEITPEILDTTGQRYSSGKISFRKLLLRRLSRRECSKK